MLNISMDSDVSVLKPIKRYLVHVAYKVAEEDEVDLNYVHSLSEQGRAEFYSTLNENIFVEGEMMKALAECINSEFEGGGYGSSGDNQFRDMLFSFPSRYMAERFIVSLKPLVQKDMMYPDMEIHYMGENKSAMREAKTIELNTLLDVRAALQ